MFSAQIKSDIDEDICILVQVANHSYNYLCDCGEAKKLTVKECRNTNAIFISHTHIDHFVNFDTILRHQIGIERKVIICGPKGITEQIQKRIQSYCWNLIEPNAIEYEVREIIANNSIRSTILRPPLWEQEEQKTNSSTTIFNENEFYVTFEILDHKTASIAYLFKTHPKTKIQLPKHIKGGIWVAALKEAYHTNAINTIIDVHGDMYFAKDLFYMIRKAPIDSLGIIMDHAANEENHQKIKRLFTNCQQVYIECFYKDEDTDAAIVNYHSYASMSAHIMKECNVTNAIPVHFSRKYSIDDINTLINQFKKVYDSK